MFMGKVPCLRNIVTIIMLAGFITSTIGPSASADDQQGKITLKKSFFGGAKFSLNEGKAKSIYGFTGMTHTRDFIEAMSTCPLALKEARKAFAYNGVALAGSLGMLAVSIKIFSKTLKDASDVSSGKMVDNSFKVGDVVMMGTAALVTITASRLGYRHLKNGLRMYNEGCLGYLTPLTPREHANEFGARFGFNSASVGDTYESKTGFNFYFYQPIGLGERIALQPEYGLTQKGYSAGVSSVSLWYLEIPLLLKVSPFGSAFRPGLFAGPVGALSLGSTTIVGGEEIDSEQEYNILDYGYVIGASVLIPNSSFSIDARYTTGLSDVIEGRTDFKNKVFSLGLGAHF